MEIDTDKLFENAIRDAIREGVKSKMGGYNSSLDKLVDAAIAKHSDKFRALLEESISTAVLDDSFRVEVKQAVHKNLAKTLIQRFGGEIEKQVNVLKSDPTTRARITLAIEDIVKQGAT
jgi:hypothetical protein